MTHETDFLDLYRRLGLAPGCDMAALKQAYRRHVAALHPDRQPGQAVDARASMRLQRLTAQYSAAMEFHRRHGRLPGAPAPAAAATATPVAPLDPFADLRAATPPPPWPEMPARPRRPHGRLALLLAVAALASLGWAMHHAAQPQPAGDEEDATAATQVSEAPVAVQDDGIVLHLGMSASEVRALEGEPLTIHGGLWEYGPSWVRFEQAQVVDWHSSPLRPLHTEARASLPR